MPENTMWIDDRIPVEDMPFVLYHEAAERRLMATGVGYDQAHEGVNKPEKELRKQYGQADLGGVPQARHKSLPEQGGVEERRGGGVEKGRRCREYMYYYDFPRPAPGAQFCVFSLANAEMAPSSRCKNAMRFNDLSIDASRASDSDGRHIDRARPACSGDTF
jgi:hypothetical protein